MSDRGSNPFFIKASRTVNDLECDVRRYVDKGYVPVGRMCIDVIDDVKYYLQPMYLVPEEIEQPPALINKYINHKVDRLNLTERARNCLKSEGITHVSHLLDTTDVDLLKISNLGKGTFNQIKMALAEAGYTGDRLV